MLLRLASSGFCNFFPYKINTFNEKIHLESQLKTTVDKKNSSQRKLITFQTVQMLHNENHKRDNFLSDKSLDRLLATIIIVADNLMNHLLRY